MNSKPTTQVFDDWLFNLLLFVEINPNADAADAHVRRQAVKAKKDWKSGKKMVTPGKEHDVKALRVFNRLIKARNPALLLRECLNESHFTADEA